MKSNAQMRKTIHNISSYQSKAHTLKQIVQPMECIIKKDSKDFTLSSQFNV